MASHDSTRRKEADRGGVARPLSDVLCTQQRRSESGIYARGKDVSSEVRAWHSSALYIPRSYIPESTGPQEDFLTFSDTLPAPLSRSRTRSALAVEYARPAHLDPGIQGRRSRRLTSKRPDTPLLTHVHPRGTHWSVCPHATSFNVGKIAVWDGGAVARHHQHPGVTNTGGAVVYRIVINL